MQKKEKEPNSKLTELQQREYTMELERFRAMKQCSSLEVCPSLERNIRVSISSEADTLLMEIAALRAEAGASLHSLFQCTVCQTWLGKSRAPPRGGGRSNGSSSPVAQQNLRIAYLMCLTCEDCPVMCYSCYDLSHFVEGGGAAPKVLHVDSEIALGLLPPGLCASMFKAAEAVADEDDALEDVTPPTEAHIVCEMLTLNPPVAARLRTEFIAGRESARRKSRPPINSWEAPPTEVSSSPLSASHSRRDVNMDPLLLQSLRRRAQLNRAEQCALVESEAMYRLQLEQRHQFLYNSPDNMSSIAFAACFEMEQCGRQTIHRVHRDIMQRVMQLLKEQHLASKMEIERQNAETIAAINTGAAEFIQQFHASCVTEFEEESAFVDNCFTDTLSIALEILRGNDNTVERMCFNEGVSRGRVSQQWLAGLSEIGAEAHSDSSAAETKTFMADHVVDHTSCGLSLYRSAFAAFVLLVSLKYLDRQRILFVKAQQRSESLRMQFLNTCGRQQFLADEKSARQALHRLRDSSKIFTTEEAQRRLLHKEVWMSMIADAEIHQRMNRLVIERQFIVQHKDLLQTFWKYTRMDAATMRCSLAMFCSSYITTIDQLDSATRDLFMSFVGGRYGWPLVCCYRWAQGTERMLSLYWDRPPPQLEKSEDDDNTNNNNDRSVTRGHAANMNSSRSSLARLRMVAGSLVRSQRNLRNNLTKSGIGGTPRGVGPWGTPRNSLLSSMMQGVGGLDPNGPNASTPPSFLSLIASFSRVPSRTPACFQTAFSYMEGMVVWSNGCKEGQNLIRETSANDEFTKLWATYEHTLRQRSQRKWVELLHMKEREHLDRLEGRNPSHSSNAMQRASVVARITPTASPTIQAQVQPDQASDQATPRTPARKTPADSPLRNSAVGDGEGGPELDSPSERNRRKHHAQLQSGPEAPAWSISKAPRLIPPMNSATPVGSKEPPRRYRGIDPPLLSSTESLFGTHFLYGPNLHTFDHLRKNQHMSQQHDPTSKTTLSSYQKRHEAIKAKAYDKMLSERLEKMSNKSSNSASPPARIRETAGTPQPPTPTAAIDTTVARPPRPGSAALPPRATKPNHDESAQLSLSTTLAYGPTVAETGSDSVRSDTAHLSVSWAAQQMIRPTASVANKSNASSSAKPAYKSTSPAQKTDARSSKRLAPDSSTTKKGKGNKKRLTQDVTNLNAFNVDFNEL